MKNFVGRATMSDQQEPPSGVEGGKKKEKVAKPPPPGGYAKKPELSKVAGYSSIYLKPQESLPFQHNIKLKNS